MKTYSERTADELKAILAEEKEKSVRKSTADKSIEHFNWLNSNGIIDNKTNDWAEMVIEEALDHAIHMINNR